MVGSCEARIQEQISELQASAGRLQSRIAADNQETGSGPPAQLASCQDAEALAAQLSAFTDAAYQFAEAHAQVGCCSSTLVSLPLHLDWCLYSDSFVAVQTWQAPGGRVQRAVQRRGTGSPLGTLHAATVQATAALTSSARILECSRRCSTEEWSKLQETSWE